VIGGIVLLLLLATGVWAYDASQDDQIAPGVTIGGVDVGDRSVDEARPIVERELVAPLRKPVFVTFEGERYKLPAKRLEQKADVEGMLDEAVEESREGGLLERVTRYVSGNEVNVDLTPRVSYSRDMVDRFVAELADDINRDPVDASVIPSGDQLSPQPGQKGVTLREDKMRRLISAQIRTPGRDGAVEAAIRHTEPEVTRAELAEAYPTFVTIDRTNFTLRLFRNLKLAKSYTIAVGQVGLETPEGLYHIQNMAVNPTWNVPNSDWAGSLAGQSIPPGPSNPLKARWMGIYDGAGIHGTDDLGSLGTAASHGCVRMAVPDVVELYDRVDVGTPVYVS